MPLPPFRLTEPPVVLSSPELNTNAPPDPRLEEPATKDASPPVPAEEAPDVSDIAPSSILVDETPALKNASPPFSDIDLTATTATEPPV
jgi:hypothetical protein